MGLGWLLRRGGRVNAPTVWTEETVGLFLRSGGRVTMREFARLDIESQKAFASVGDAYASDLVSSLAMAISDPEFASRLGVRADGGAQRETDIMGAALAGVGRNILEGRQ